MASSIGAERHPPAALASVYPTGVTEVQWAVAVGLKRTSGTFQTYKSRLRSASRIEQRAALSYATDDRLFALGETEIPVLPEPGPELVAY